MSPTLICEHGGQLGLEMRILCVHTCTNKDNNITFISTNIIITTHIIIIIFITTITTTISSTI